MNWLEGIYRWMLDDCTNQEIPERIHRDRHERLTVIRLEKLIFPATRVVFLDGLGNNITDTFFDDFSGRIISITKSDSTLYLVGALDDSGMRAKVILPGKGYALKIGNEVTVSRIESSKNKRRYD